MNPLCKNPECGDTKNLHQGGEGECLRWDCQCDAFEDEHCPHTNIENVGDSIDVIIRCFDCHVPLDDNGKAMR